MEEMERVVHPEHRLLLLDGLVTAFNVEYDCTRNCGSSEGCSRHHCCTHVVVPKPSRTPQHVERLTHQMIAPILPSFLRRSHS